MRIEILDEAQDDLLQGFHFYEGQEAGLGSYFLDCLFSDIDSLLLYAGDAPSYIYVSPMPLQALSICHLLQIEGTVGARACCLRLSQKSILD